MSEMAKDARSQSAQSALDESVKLADQTARQVNQTVALQIFDREYRLACPAEQSADLKRAAQLLDTRLRELKSADKMLTLDRLAVLAALTFAQELVGEGGAQDQQRRQISEELKRLNAKLDGALRAA
jgi:cell division protein ZapA